MRISVCLSGELRNYKDTFPYFKKYIIDKLNPDIFIYTNKYEDFLDNYNYKDINIQESTIQQYAHGYNKVHSSTNEISLLNQHYKIEQCNLLKINYENINNFKYDIVIRCRLDAFFTRYFSDEELKITTNEILVPWGWDFKGVSPHAETDIFALGDSATMDLYSNSFSNINKYKNDTTFHSESIIGYNLFKYGILVNTYQINFQFAFPEYDINNNKHDLINILKLSEYEYVNSPYNGKNYFCPKK